MLLLSWYVLVVCLCYVGMYRNGLLFFCLMDSSCLS